MNKIVAASRLRAANSYYAHEILDIMMSPNKMPAVKESRQGYVVFTEQGDCLYDGFNQTVARLVAASCSLPVY